MNSKGFTLIEILIALAIALLLMTGIYSVYRMQHKSYLVQEQVAAMQQNLRAALYIMEIDIRRAGYDPTQRATPNPGIANTSSNTKLVMSQDVDEDGSIDVAAEPDEGITYELFDFSADGDTDLGRQRGTTAVQPVAENIDAVDFVYIDETGGTIDPSTGDPTAIRMVEVTLVARANQPDRDYKNNNVYRNEQGDVVFSGGGDNFRRRSATKRIRARNMGM